MHIFIIIVLSLIALVLVFLLAIVIYDFILLKKRPLLQLYEQRKAQDNFCTLDEMPEKLRHFFVILEDSGFYQHKGFLLEGIRDAIYLNGHARTIVTGGSTITQQLIKNLYFKFNKSYLRKLAEFFLALYAERKLGKDRILEFYLNIIYFGNGVYGVYDAAAFYLNKNIHELSANQMFLLAAIPKAPTAGNPIQHPAVFERLRNKRVMVNLGDISEEDKNEILAHDASCLDEALRKNDDFTKNYSQQIVLINEIYGPQGKIGFKEKNK